MHAIHPPCPRILQYRPPRMALLLVTVATALAFIVGESLPAHSPNPVAALIVALSGFAIMIRAWWLFKTMDTAICPTARASVLITSDVYARTRNPMYLGMIAMMIGVALLTGSVFHYAAALGFFAIIDHSFCRFEEAQLERSFGSDFRKYAAKTRRWF